MAIKKTDEQNYIDIANAIRTVNGSEETYTPGEMAQAIIEGENVDIITLDAANDLALTTEDIAKILSHQTDGKIKVIVKDLNGYYVEVPMNWYIDNYSTSWHGFIVPPQSMSYISVSFTTTSNNVTNQSFIIPVNNSTTITVVRTPNTAITMRGFCFPLSYFGRFNYNTGTLNNLKLIIRPIDNETGLPRTDYYYEYAVSEINEADTRITMTRTQINL